jgi:hypothetical protein
MKEEGPTAPMKEEGPKAPMKEEEGPTAPMKEEEGPTAPMKEEGGLKAPKKENVAPDQPIPLAPALPALSSTAIPPLEAVPCQAQPGVLQSKQLESMSPAAGLEDLQSDSITAKPSTITSEVSCGVGAVSASDALPVSVDSDSKSEVQAPMPKDVRPSDPPSLSHLLTALSLNDGIKGIGTGERKQDSHVVSGRASNGLTKSTRQGRPNAELAVTPKSRKKRTRVRCAACYPPFC